MEIMLTVNEVALFLGVSYRTALTFVRQHKLAVKVGRQYRVPESVLMRLIEKSVDPDNREIKWKRY